MHEITIPCSCIIALDLRPFTDMDQCRTHAKSAFEKKNCCLVHVYIVITSVCIYIYTLHIDIHRYGKTLCPVWGSGFHFISLRNKAKPAKLYCAQLTL